MLRDAGAAEVHLRISSPPTRWPCYYGIDTPSREELIAANAAGRGDPRATSRPTPSATCRSTACCARSPGRADSYCTACWSGEYRVPMAGEDARQRLLFPIRAEGGELSVPRDGAWRSGAYRAAGVDIDAQDRALARVKELVRSTVDAAGALRARRLRRAVRRSAGLREPVLVASADGVGTKLAVAKHGGRLLDRRPRPRQPLRQRHPGAGRAAALLPRLRRRRRARARGTWSQLVAASPHGCRENGCALLGGETAEMPGFYQPGDYELVGFIVGVVERDAAARRHARRAGRRAASACRRPGLHTNGYSLARRILFDAARASGSATAACPATATRPHGRRGAARRRTCSYLAPLPPLLGHPGAARAGPHHRRRPHRQRAAQSCRDGDARADPARELGGPPLFRLLAGAGGVEPRRCSASSTWGSAWCWWWRRRPARGLRAPRARRRAAGRSARSCGRRRRRSTTSEGDGLASPAAESARA